MSFLSRTISSCVLSVLRFHEIAATLPMCVCCLCFSSSAVEQRIRPTGVFTTSTTSARRRVLKSRQRVVCLHRVVAMWRSDLYFTVWYILLRSIYDCIVCCAEVYITAWHVCSGPHHRVDDIHGYFETNLVLHVLSHSFWLARDMEDRQSNVSEETNVVLFGLLTDLTYVCDVQTYVCVMYRPYLCVWYTLTCMTSLSS